MKQLILSIVWLVLLGISPVQAQVINQTNPPAKPQDPQSLIQLDEALANPLETRIITDIAYSKMLYQQQVKLSGMAVQQGKTLGLNVTADDKGGTLNLGSLALGKCNNVAIQATAKYQAEQGFVKLFTDEKYQKTLNLGLTVLVFNQGNRKFEDQTRKAFQHTIRQQREEDKKYWEESVYKKRWQDTFYIYQERLLKFRQERRRFAHWLLDGLSQNEIAKYVSSGAYPKQNGDQDKAIRLKWYDQRDTELPLTDIKDSKAQKLYQQYVDAEQDIYQLLGDKWPGLSYRDEIPVLKDVSNMGADSLASLNGWLSSKLSGVWTEQNNRKLKDEGDFYDSQQQAVSWRKKSRCWLSFSAFYNTVRLPIFSLANKPQTYAAEKLDEYFQAQAAFNYMKEGEGDRFNIYYSIGGGVNDMLVFSKKNLLTYQTSLWQRTGKDSALVVTQKQLYSVVPPRVWYINLHPQGAITFPQLYNIGISLSADLLLAINEPAAQDKYSYAAGVFVPVRADKTTLLLMPQIRWKNTDEPNPWTIGFSLTASVPGLMK